MSFQLTVEYEADNKSITDQTMSTMVLEISRMNMVSEISSSIYRHAQANLRLPEDQYCLYWPENKVWLIENRPIGRLLHGVRSARVQFRPKFSPFKIRFLDASSKIIILDETQPVKDIVGTICRQLSLHHPEEMSLVVAVDYAVTKHHPTANQDRSTSPIVSPKRDLSISDTSLSPRARRRQLRPGSAEGGRPGSGERPGSGVKRKSHVVTTKRKQLSHKYQIRIDTPWLDPQKTLIEQEVTCSDDLILMYRYYYHMQLERESKESELLYKQARAMFLAGEMMSNSELVPKFTALLCQITRGDFKSKEETQELLFKIKRLLAPPKYKPKNLIKDVAVYYKMLRGLTVHDAKCWFIKLWSTSHLFGTEFFSCINTDIKEKGLLGVSKEKVLFLHLNNKKKNREWDAHSLSHWQQEASNDGIVTLHFDNGTCSDKLRILIPDYSSILVDCLKGHKELAASFKDSRPSRQEYHFDEDETMVSEFQRYFTTSEPKRGHKRVGSLTYNEVCLADKITEDNLAPSSPSNAVANGHHYNTVKIEVEEADGLSVEQLNELMEEKFSFLDFNEDIDELSSNDTPTSLKKKLVGISAQQTTTVPSPLLNTSRASVSSTDRERTSSDSSSEDNGFRGSADLRANDQ